MGEHKALPNNPHAARLLAHSYLPEIADAVAGLDMVFLVAEMVDAVGSGISPMIAQMLRAQDILTLAFATLPFNFESQQRKQNAQTGIRELRVHVNALLPFPNSNIELVGEENASLTSLSSQAALAIDHYDDTLGNEITVSVLASGIRRAHPVSTNTRIKSEPIFIKPSMRQCTPP